MEVRSSRDCRACLAWGLSNLDLDDGVLFPLLIFSSLDMNEKRTVFTLFISFLPRLEADFVRDTSAGVLVSICQTDMFYGTIPFGTFRPNSR